MRIARLLIVAGLVVASASCVLKQTQHVLYLEPDGSVVWTVLESDVHSDADAIAERVREECDWLSAAEAADHGVARGLSWLGARPEVRVLRAERPFVVFTEARYPAFGDLAARLVDGLHLPARVASTRGPDGSGLVLEIDLADAEEIGREDCDPLTDLLAGMGDLRLVLGEGRFTAAEGFELDDDLRVARPLTPPDELLESGHGTVRWTLSWSSAPPPAPDAAAAVETEP